MPSLAEILAARKNSQAIKNSQAFRQEQTSCNYTNSLGQSLNSSQSLAVDYALQSKSFCLIGAAGTGKTTSVLAICEQLIRQDKLHSMPSHSSSKNLRNKKSVAFVAFTNRAVKRLKKSIPKELQDNAYTIHALTEYQPEYVTSFDEYGQPCTKRIFAPKLNPFNPDPHLQLVIVEDEDLD